MGEGSRRGAAAAACVLAALVALWSRWGVWDAFLVDAAWMDVHIGRDIAEGGPRVLWEYLGWTVEGRHYRPLPYLTYALDWHLWGASAAGRHAANLALHAACASLVAAAALRLGGGPLYAAGAGALYAAHPIAAPSMTYTYFRQDTLACLFSLLSVLAAASALDRGGARRWIATALASLAVGLSKEIAFVLPALAAAFLWNPGDPRRRASAVLRAAFALALPLLALLAFRRWGLGLAPLPRAEALDAARAWEAASDIAARTAAAFVRPAPEAGAAGDAARRAWGWIAAAGASALVLSAAAGAAARRLGSAPLRALAWTALAAAPTFAPVLLGLTLDPTTRIFQTYRLPLANAGFALLVASPLLARGRAARAAAALAVLAGVAGFGAESRAAVRDAERQGRYARDCWEAAGAAPPAPEGRILFDAGVDRRCRAAFAERVFLPLGVRPGWAELAADGSVEETPPPPRANYPPAGARRMSAAEYFAEGPALFARPLERGALCLEIAADASGLGPETPCSGVRAALPNAPAEQP